MFYPENAVVPEMLRTEEMLIRPLQATDVELDYDAVVTSRAELFLRSDGAWPREGFTLAENLVDLIRHEREHRERVAFTYTVMNPTETLCLGCLYINPLTQLFQTANSVTEPIVNASAYITFWVRQSHLQIDLDRRLLEALISWFRNEWSFSQVTFVAKKAQERQIQLFEEQGMQRLYALQHLVVFA